MPVFSAKLFTFDLDSRRHSDALAKEIMVQIRQAARQFVKIASLSVPVRTGFAQGTFRNILAALGDSGGTGLPKTPANNFLGVLRKIRQESFNRPISPRKHGSLAQLFKLTPTSLRAAAGERGLGIPIEFYRDGKQKILKTPESGRQFATRIDKIFNVEGFIFTFNFSVAISYFNINDFRVNPRNPGTPWQAFFRGRAFFLQYLRQFGLKQLPSVNDFLIEHEINVTGTSVSKVQTSRLNRRTTIRIK